MDMHAAYLSMSGQAFNNELTGRRPSPHVYQLNLKTALHLSDTRGMVGNRNQYTNLGTDRVKRSQSAWAKEMRPESRFSRLLN